MIRFKRGDAETECVPDMLRIVGLQNNADFHNRLAYVFFLFLKLLLVDLALGVSLL